MTAGRVEKFDYRQIWTREFASCVVYSLSINETEGVLTFINVIHDTIRFLHKKKVFQFKSFGVQTKNWTAIYRIFDIGTSSLLMLFQLLGSHW